MIYALITTLSVLIFTFAGAQTAPQPSAVKPQPVTSDTSNEKQKTLDALWADYEATYNLAALSLAGTEKRTDPKSPKAQLLARPEVKALIMSKLKEKFLSDVQKAFNEREVAYLQKLYASSYLKKMSRIEREMWNNVTPNAIIDQALKEYTAQMNAQNSANTSPQGAPPAPNTPAPAKDR